MHAFFRYLTLTFVPLIHGSLVANLPETAPRWQAGISTGTAVLFGELPHRKPGFSSGIFINTRMRQNMSFEIQGITAIYRSGAQDISYLPSPGAAMTHKARYSLQTNSFQLSLMFRDRLFETKFLNLPIALTASGGIGLARYSAVSTYTDMSDSASSGLPNPNFGKGITETFAGNHYSFPFGLALSLKPSSKTEIGILGQYQFTHTDDIDIINPSTFSNNRYDRTFLLQLRFGYSF